MVNGDRNDTEVNEMITNALEKTTLRVTAGERITMKTDEVMPGEMDVTEASRMEEVLQVQ